MFLQAEDIFFQADDMFLQADGKLYQTGDLFLLTDGMMDRGDGVISSDRWKDGSDGRQAFSAVVAAFSAVRGGVWIRQSPAS